MIISNDFQRIIWSQVSICKIVLLHFTGSIVVTQPIAQLGRLNGGTKENTNTNTKNTKIQYNTIQIQKYQHKIQLHSAIVTS